ncbi:hypothetical protein S40285_00955 [Stachybotrys chlorohalonatus IBT 40285]|uniref:FAD-binding PCMH-type domain-containing protein n=1 Tax=Stachybotrys chlorohalonatus (strain IBT 40285) TaxID=1283841 RepID=A0A084QUQ8_STAC4|nr:hypothetical protein S40285_00955 [Stachybotrys chlorohalonata IBT 40285]
MWTKAVSYATLLGLLVAQATATCTRDIRSILLEDGNTWSARTTITFPEDGAAFNNVTGRWSIYAAPTYAAAISPGTEEDVIKAVKLARQHGINFLATGGRHSVVNTLERLQNGLAIDLSKFNSIQVDRDAATLTIGGGVITRDVFGPVSEAGLEIPVGSCSCTGFVGVTLGGGASSWLAQRGMISDSLLSARLITAEGEVVEVSETSNADLFWALRGAGTNFGIITSATYQLYPHTNNDEIVVIDMTFPPQANLSYYNAIESIWRVQPAELSASSMIIYNGTLGMPLIVGSFLYFGSREDALEVLAPVLNLRPLGLNINISPWSRLSNTILMGNDRQTCIPGSIHNTYAAFARQVSVPFLVRTFEAMSDFYAANPAARRSLAAYRYHGHGPADEIPDDATAFPWRNSEAGMEVIFDWTPGHPTAEAASDSLGQQIRDDFVATSGYDELAVYVNMARASDTLENIYGAHRLPRLAALKRAWDPDNVFRNHHPLPTSYP